MIENLQQLNNFRKNKHPTKFAIYALTDAALYKYYLKQSKQNKAIVLTEIQRRKNEQLEIRNDFLNISNTTELADFFELNFGKIFYSLGKGNHKIKRYHNFTITKRNGNLRSICAPNKFLKSIQWKLNYVLNLVYIPTKATHGFVSFNLFNENFRSIKTNADFHKRKKYILNIDLKDFFPSITGQRVFGMFKSYPFKFNDQIAALLKEICIDDETNLLPQGAPTSPIITNIICKQLDKELIDLSKKNKVIFTRYADDLTFSCNYEIAPSFANDVYEIIKKHDFQVNPDKTHYMSNSMKKIVTGLVVNNKTNISRKFYRTVRAMLHNLETDGLDACQEKFNEMVNGKSFLNVLRGRIEYIGMVRGKFNEKDEYRLYERLVNKYNSLVNPTDNSFNKKELSKDSELTNNVESYDIDQNFLDEL